MTNWDGVNKELNERYDGDALKLKMLIGSFSVETWEGSVESMLENGCFCPSCMLMYLEGE